MRVWGMRPGVSITLLAADRRRLKMIIGDRNAPQKHVWRAEIVLLSADGLGTVEIMRRTGKSKTCVWRWQERFAEDGIEGLLRDKTRPARGPWTSAYQRPPGTADQARAARSSGDSRARGAA